MALHALVMAGLLFAHQSLAPEPEAVPVELVMLPAEPESTSAAPQRDEAAPVDQPTPEHQPVPEPAAPERVPIPDEAVPERQPLPETLPVLEHAAEPDRVTPPRTVPVVPEPVPPSILVPEPPAAQAPRPPPHRAAVPSLPAAPPRLSPTKDRIAPLAEASSASPASPPQVVQQEEPARTDPNWLAGVSEWLRAHISYPEMARRLGRQGTVVVQITIGPDGHVLEVILVQSSGSALLDQAAEALMRTAHLPPFPPDMKLPQQNIKLPIRYRLE
ncbi:MAG: TonB family protein [Rhodopila sp.]|jgi:protein TonB